MEENNAGSPVMVRRDGRDPAGRAAQLESELARVIRFMNQSGITAAGIRITGARDACLNREYVSSYDLVNVERLMSARAVIRKDAEDTTGLYALPDAMLVLHGVAVTLLGDDRAGTLPDSGSEFILAEEAAAR